MILNSYNFLIYGISCLVLAAIIFFYEKRMNDRHLLSIFFILLGIVSISLYANSVLNPQKYSCNTINYTCSLNENGIYDNKGSCDSDCIKPPPAQPTKYFCDTKTYTCSLDDKGTYKDKASCDSDCVKPIPPSSNNKIVLGYWENWNNTDYGKFQYCSNIGCPIENDFNTKTENYNMINWSFAMLSKYWYSGYDPGNGCSAYNTCGGAGGCPSCIDAKGNYINKPSNALYTVAACRINPSYPPFIDINTTKDNLSEYPDILSARYCCKLAHVHPKGRKHFNLAFGGWSDCITLVDENSNLILARLISNSILFTFADGVDLDFEHFTQLSPLNKEALPNRSVDDRKTQLKLFGDLVGKIRAQLNTITVDKWNNVVNTITDDDTYKKSLINNKPNFTISFTTRYNAFFTNDDCKKYFNLDNPTSGEGLDLIKLDSDFINTVDYVNLMIYDDNFNVTDYAPVYKKIVELTIQGGVPVSKILCGVEPGKQAGSGDASDQTSSIANIVNLVKSENAAGIFFWAINDKDQEDFSIYVALCNEAFKI